MYAHAAPVHTRARDCPIIMSDYFIGHAIKLLPSIDGRNGRCEALVVSGAEWMGGKSEQIVRGRPGHAP